MQVLAFSSGRLRLGSLGFVDALSRPISGPEELRMLQREDMQARQRSTVVVHGMHDQRLHYSCPQHTSWAVSAMWFGLASYHANLWQG